MSALPDTPATTAPQGFAWQQPPSTIAERFVLEAFRGAGGMGSVYLARDLFSGERVAVKLLRRELKSPHTERFAREASLLAELRHPGIVRHVAHGLVGAGQAYLAMEWLDGETLHARLQRGPLSEAETVKLAGKLLAALAAIHRLGIIHRDIKPSNIMLVGGRVESPRILDFGIARRHIETAPVTVAGAAPGTPMYMSPEQARATGPVDHRCDIFSLGCVLFECLTGEPLFTGETPLAILARIRVAGPDQSRQRMRGVLPALASILETMLASDAASRAGDASALAQALSEIPAPALGEMAPPAPRALVGDGEEKRVSPVLLIRPGQGRRSSGAVMESSLRLFRSVLTPFSARLSPFIGGCVVVTFDDGGAPTDLCRVAARAALELRAAAPTARIAMSLGPVVVGSSRSLDGVIDRTAELLATARRPCIVVDETSAALLAPQFILRGAAPRSSSPSAARAIRSER